MAVTSKVAALPMIHGMHKRSNLIRDHRENADGYCGSEQTGDHLKPLFFYNLIMPTST